jgi:Kef-type K+ transport system membrane component KefB
VTIGGVEPMVVCDSRRVIARARRVAFARDAAQIVLLASVDGLFSNFSSTRIPLLSRSDSLVVLGIVNAAILAHVWLARALPKWSTRRIATTWCARERSRVTSPVSSARG